MTYGQHHRSQPGLSPRDNYEIRLLSQGPDLAVQLDEVKLSLRADSDDEDITIRRIIRGMTDYFSRRTGWVLTPCTFEALVGGCGHAITLERGPYRAIDGVFWWDSTDRDWVQIDPAEFQVEERGNEFDLLFSDAAYSSLPAPTYLRPRPVRVQFSAGFDSPEVSETTVNGTAEDGMVMSLLSLIAHAYEEREAGAANNNTLIGQDPAKDYLLGVYRKFW